jgi:hypothetical protein
MVRGDGIIKGGGRVYIAPVGTPLEDREKWTEVGTAVLRPVVVHYYRDCPATEGGVNGYEGEVDCAVCIRRMHATGDVWAGAGRAAASSPSTGRGASDEA